MLTSWHIMPTWVSVFSTARYTQWEWGWLGGYSTGLVVERSWICRSPRRSGGRLSSQSRISWLSVLTYFGIRCSPGHSAKSAGSRSELDWYICTLPMWLCELKWQCKLVHGCISSGVHRTCAAMVAVSCGNSHVTTKQCCHGVHHFGGLLEQTHYKKNTVTHSESHMQH